MNERTVLVTGCAGYIGTILCQELLTAGFQVLGVDCLVYNQEASLLHLIGHKNFEFYWQDCRKIDELQPLLKRADVIIPLAAVVGAPACDQHQLFAQQVNFEAVRDLVKAASPYQRIVYPNTNSGYGHTDAVQGLTETDPMEPISHYGRTKCDAEKIVLDHRMGVSLRLATVFGLSPRMRFDLMVNDFTAKLMREQALTIFEPHFKRNFLHIRDVARVFHFMANDQRHVGAFNVCLSEHLTKLELGHLICKCLGLYKDRVTIGEGRDPDQRNYIVSNQKLTNTGFTLKHDLTLGIYDIANVARMLTPPKFARMRNA